QPASSKIQSPVVAVRVVPGTAEQGMSCPGAAGAAYISVVAGPAVAPEVVSSAIPRDRQFRAGVPDLGSGQVPDVTAGIGHSRQRWATLDRAVSFDSNRILAGVAPAPMYALVASASPKRLVGAEVADVVAGLHDEVVVETFFVELCKQ